MVRPLNIKAKEKKRNSSILFWYKLLGGPQGLYRVLLNSGGISLIFRLSVFDCKLKESSKFMWTLIFLQDVINMRIVWHSPRCTFCCCFLCSTSWLYISADNEIPTPLVCHGYRLFLCSTSSSRMLGFGSCSTALPQVTPMAWYQRPRPSSHLWGFFTTIVYTPTLRYC